MALVIAEAPRNKILCSALFIGLGHYYASVRRPGCSLGKELRVSD